ncbi:uncharacterized protein LOC118458287 [Anopheles albimanus]|uniref:uncharacterized protein LOC118458287 n=1 Tax=Anopheles albimanus TaxID=7167 RepID=UPI00163F34EC|nr:uncharacterized protein LOC118458287 [Anopheles albimanus]
MAFKLAAAIILLLVAVAINGAPQLDQLPGGMTPPTVGEMPVGGAGGNQTNPGDLTNNLNTTVPENPMGGVGGAENATMPSNIGGGIPNRISNRIQNSRNKINGH